MLKVKKLSFIREVQILLVKAERKLEHAQRAYNVGDYDSALGDSYRCVELCIRALLLSHGIIKIPKTHGGILQLFSKELVLKGGFPRELAKEIGLLASQRAKADYSPLFIDEEEATNALEIASKTLETTKKIMR